jgi:mono/diheme cytochrome c family protein
MRIACAVILAVGLCSASAQAQDKKAERTWKAKCASCHGADGKGDTDQGKKMKLPDMTSAKWHSKTTDAKIREAILNGVKSESGEMQVLQGLAVQRPGRWPRQLHPHIEEVVGALKGT